MKFAWYALRSLVFYIGYAFIMITQTLASVAIMPFVSTAFLHRFTVTACRVSVRWARIACGIRYEMIGAENIPPTPCVVLAKHQSAWETLYLQGWLQPATTVAKRELLRIPVFGWGMALTGPIVIDRGQRSSALKEVIRQGTERLHGGQHVIIYPEGTRMLPGQQGEYSAGGTMLAVKAGVPVLPVALNSGDCWPRGTLIKRPGLIRVEIGKPIASEGASAKELIVQARDWIEQNLEARAATASQ